MKSSLFLGRVFSFVLRFLALLQIFTTRLYSADFKISEDEKILAEIIYIIDIRRLRNRKAVIFYAPDCFSLKHLKMLYRSKSFFHHPLYFPFFRRSFLRFVHVKFFFSTRFCFSQLEIDKSLGCDAERTHYQAGEKASYYICPADNY